MVQEKDMEVEEEFILSFPIQKEVVYNLDEDFFFMTSMITNCTPY